MGTRDEELEDQTVVQPASGRSSSQSVAGGAFQAVVVSSSILKIHPLPQAGKVTIGRYHGSGIAIEDETISRFHAVLHIGPPFAIEDVGSANGTSIEGAPVTPGMQKAIDLGAVIKLGNVALIVQKRPRPGSREP